MKRYKKRPWTVNDKLLLVHLTRVKGLTATECSKKLKRSPSAVSKMRAVVKCHQPNKWADPEKLERIMEELEALAKRENVDVGTMINRARKEWYGYKL